MLVTNRLFMYQPCQFSVCKVGILLITQKPEKKMEGLLRLGWTKAGLTNEQIASHPNKLPWFLFLIAVPLAQWHPKSPLFSKSYALPKYA